uniref:Uncharacterized protein n=1 Tax=Knipowitschia caucasica TaxID=637954 RepID=A0AAV2L852_KNICA
MAQDRSSSPDARSLGSITPERITLRPEREEPEPRLSSHTSRVRAGNSSTNNIVRTHQLLESRGQQQKLTTVDPRPPQRSALGWRR